MRNRCYGPKDVCAERSLVDLQQVEFRLFKIKGKKYM